MNPSRRRLARFFGRAVILALWAACLGGLAFFGAVYAIYADVKAPSHSHLVAGTGGEVVAYRFYSWFFRPIWQADPRCIVYDPEFVYVPKPGAVHFFGPEFDTTITMSPEGLRRQPAAEVAPSRPIVIAGDSYAMGWGVQDAETFSAMLATRYHHPTVNTGVSSYGTARELLRLRRLGLLAKASMIVIQFCENDDGENEEFLRDPVAMQSRRRTTELWQRTNWHEVPPVTYRAVLRASVHYVRDRARDRGWRGMFSELRHGRLPPFGVPVETRHRRPVAEVVERFLAVWDAFPELAGKPVIVTELNPNAGDAGFLRELQARVRSRANFRVVPLRLTPEDMFRFDGHLNVRGNAAVAAQLDEAIRELAGSRSGVPQVR